MSCYASTTVNHEKENPEHMRTHAEYSPSKLEKYEICPGYERDESQDTTKADEGDLMHLAVEKGNLEILETNEQKAMVQQCLDWESRLLSKLKIVHDLREQRLEIPGVTYGFADRVIIHEKHGKLHAILPDWKFGVVPVTDAKDNRQGMAYVSGAFHQFPEIETAMPVFVLPRQDTITHHCFHRKEHARIDLTIRTIIDRARLYRKTQDASMLRMTEENCLYCGAKATCPLIRPFCLSLANRYAPLEVPPEVHSSQVTSEANAAKLYAALRIMEKMVDSGKKHLVDLALQNDGLRDEQGNKVYEIAERAGTRTIKDHGVAYLIFREYLDADELAQACKITLGEAIKLATDKADKGKKKALRAEIETKLLDADVISSGEPVRYLRKVGKKADDEPKQISE